MRLMRALSVQQPWAWLIVNNHKPVENRTWYCGHRGPLLIHAGLRLDVEGLEWVREEFPEIALPWDYERGGIVGRVNMTDCVADHPSPWFFGPHGFVFEDAAPLEFRPCRGKLGLFFSTYAEPRP
jgi:hypothetical protein